MRRATLLAVVLLAASPAPRAGPAEETVRVEGEADRAATDPTGSVTVIRPEQFAGRITTIVALLEQAAGLNVRSLGGPGAFATLSVRGSTAEQVNIYLDGVLLNTSLGGGVNLSDLSLSAVESIEIYRGYTPSFLPGGAIGGAVVIRTRGAGEEGARGTASLTYGSYGTGEAAGLVSWRGDRTEGLLSADVRGSRGDYRFWDNNGTYHEPRDDGWETRRNNDHLTFDLLGRATIRMAGGGRFETRADLTRRRQGVPGIDSFQSGTAESGTTRALLGASYAREGLLAGTMVAHVDLHAGITRQEFADRFGETTPLSTDTRSLTTSAGPSLRVTWHPRGGGTVRHFATVVATGRHETAERTDHLNDPSDRGRARRLGWSVGAEDEIHLGGGRWIVSPSLRYESFSSRFAAEPGVPDVPAAQQDDARLTGRLGAAWHPHAAIRLRAGAGHYYRVPSFTEVFGDQGAVSGSDDLRPEKGRNYDAGVVFDLPAGPGDGAARRSRLHLDLSAYRNEAEDLIQFRQTSPGRFVATNTTRARIVGAELAASVGLPGRLDAGLSYSWQRARDRGDSPVLRGTDLPGRPRHEVSARVSTARGWGVPFWEFDYMGPTFFDPASASVGGPQQGPSSLPRDLVRVPGRYFHGAGWTTPPGRHLDVTIEVDNIFNVKTVDVARHPLPGRMVSARVRLRLP